MGNALRGMLDKAYIIVNELLGAILVRAQEEKRRAADPALQVDSLPTELSGKPRHVIHEASSNKLINT